ncbi:hypothetical protein MAA8898_01557 [Maliponia aquimaris]|uniref:Uncharacterized protein n=1 Tax=Maliponia aquimaris TaxID=1673631 RepID=A0A238K692_9RHOB|nr:hypothetical protein MAA8898_01557 [Maliponia aquimaris]
MHDAALWGTVTGRPPESPPASRGPAPPGWGLVTITFKADTGHFSAVLKDCASHRPFRTVGGAPGK